MIATFIAFIVILEMLVMYCVYDVNTFVQNFILFLFTQVNVVPYRFHYVMHLSQMISSFNFTFRHTISFVTSLCSQYAGNFFINLIVHSMPFFEINAPEFCKMVN